MKLVGCVTLCSIGYSLLYFGDERQVDQQYAAPSEVARCSPTGVPTVSLPQIRRTCQAVQERLALLLVVTMGSCGLTQLATPSPVACGDKLVMDIPNRTNDESS